MLTRLTAISPIDGRYHAKCQELSPLFSEFGLIRHRLIIEIRWLQALSANKEVKECAQLSKEAHAHLERILTNFDEKEAEKVKLVEETTNHDVKAVEYYLKSQCDNHDELKGITSFIHFALTSEDVNNLAYAVMIQAGKNDILLPTLQGIIDQLSTLAKNTKDISMLSHTHGQPASPTTLGKEIANVVVRLKRQLESLRQMTALGKCNGAVGNFNAHMSAYETIDWPAVSKAFIENLGLESNAYTTQIEPHDWCAELFHAFSRINTILIDFSRDSWSYISMGYFTQKRKKHEVGSSTMPHKVNPIDFENAEGNLGLANALFQFFSEKLPVSRLQRDLSDSTVLRNIGTAFAHSVIAYQALKKGIDKLQVNQANIKDKLEGQWVLLAEPIQTVMRAHGIDDAYEQLKRLSRGETLTKESVHAFIETLSVPDKAKQHLKSLTPSNYTGIASKLVTQL